MVFKKFKKGRIKMSKVLEINNLTLAFKINKKEVNAVNKVSLYADEGEIVALVGESGCGKSLTALSAVNLRPTNSKIVSGEIEINGEDVLSYSKSDWNKKRGNDFSIIFQEPMTALDPLVKIGKQIKEAILIHSDKKIDSDILKDQIITMLESVKLKNPQLIYNSYPHQLSGGMRQRVLIALSLINNPSLLIADEPTTALDVTVQKQVLNILKEMNVKKNLSILFISHDLGVVKNFCSRIYVMYAGTIVESGGAKDLIDNPKHPYTKGLIDSIPSLKNRGTVLSTIKGRVPTLEKRVTMGCPFASRCSLAKPVCYAKMPLKQERGNRALYCHMIDLKDEETCHE
jgi:peptide/nickel transport system ATP-binding protein